MSHLEPNIKMPVFTDYVKNVDPLEATDLRFFMQNMCVPIECEAEFAYDQIKTIQNNTGVHPHLRMRARHALNIAHAFNHKDQPSAYVPLNKNNGVPSLVRFDQKDFQKLPAVIPTIDHIISSLCGHILMPKNIQTLTTAFRIINNNYDTELKFIKFRTMMIAVLRDWYEMEIHEVIDFLEQNPELAKREKGSVQKYHRDFKASRNSTSNVVSL